MHYWGFFRFVSFVTNNCKNWKESHWNWYFSHLNTFNHIFCERESNKWVSHDTNSFKDFTNVMRTFPEFVIKVMQGNLNQRRSLFWLNLFQLDPFTNWSIENQEKILSHYSWFQKWTNDRITFKNHLWETKKQINKNEFN